MQNIIDKLYDLHVNTAPFPFGIPNKENTNEEWRLYSDLYEKLTQEHKTMFLKYVDLMGNRQSEETRAAYEYGFKTAIQLIAEALKE